MCVCQIRESIKGLANARRAALKGDSEEHLPQSADILITLTLLLSEGKPLPNFKRKARKILLVEK